MKDVRQPWPYDYSEWELDFKWRMARFNFLRQSERKNTRIFSNQRLGIEKNNFHIIEPDIVAQVNRVQTGR